MARVTVEDCVLRVPNRFELVLVAAQRARDIAAGGGLTLERDNDKNPVVALREIAEATVPLETLQNALIKGMQKHVEVDEPEEDREFAAEGVWPTDIAEAPGMGEEGEEEAVAKEEMQEDMLFVEGGEDAGEPGDLPAEAPDEER